LKFAQICSKRTLKYTIFVNIQKRPKNDQMAKPFYFWKTVSKKAKWQPWYQACQAQTSLRAAKATKTAEGAAKVLKNSSVGHI